MRLNASLAHERRVAVAIAGWMQLLLDLNTAALKILKMEVQATARMAVFRKGFPYVLWDMDRFAHDCYLWLYKFLALGDSLYPDVSPAQVSASSNVCILYQHSIFMQ